MSAPRPRTAQPVGAHVCRSLQPATGAAGGRGASRSGLAGAVALSELRWSGDVLLDQDQMDRLDEELDEGLAQVAAALDLITQLNMREYAGRFGAALAADAILPEDF